MNAKHKELNQSRWIKINFSRPLLTIIHIFCFAAFWTNYIDYVQCAAAPAMRFFSSRNKTVYLSKAYPFVRFDCVIFSTITNSLVFWKTSTTINLWLFWFLFCCFYTATCWWQFGCEYFASHGTCCSRKLYIKNLRHDNTKGEVASILSIIPNTW